MNRVSKIAIFPELKRRAQSPTISPLSVRENTKVQSFSPVTTPKATHLNIESLTETKLPDTEKLDRIITKLDAVTSSKNEAIPLVEDKERSILADETQVKQFKISSYRKKTDLLVHIKRHRGTIRTFVSRNGFPSADFHDYVFKEDTFSLTEHGLKFKTEFFGLSIYTVSFTKLTISIKFGVKKRTPSNKHTDDNSPTMHSLPKISPPRNFIDNNIRNAYSPKEKPEFFQNWGSRRHLVLEKRANRIQEKKERAEIFIRRHAEIKEESNKLKHKALMQLETKNRQKAWIILIKLAQTIKVLSEELSEFEGPKLPNNQCSEMVSAEQIIMVRSNNLLLFYSSLVKPKIKVLKFISHSAKLKLPVIQCHIFYNKVVYIQRVVRSYLKLCDQQWLSLIAHWNTQMERLKKLSKHNYEVSNYIRNKTLLEFLRQKRINFIKKLKQHDKISQKFLIFQYKPTYQQMIELIKKIQLHN